MPLTPSQWNHERLRCSNEDCGSDPIEVLDLCDEIARDLAEFEEEEHRNGSDADNGQIDPKNPCPRDILSEGTAHQRTSYCTNGPHAR